MYIIPKLFISDGEREVVSPFSSTPRVNMQAEFARRKVRSAWRRLTAIAMEARQGGDVKHAPPRSGDSATIAQQEVPNDGR